MGVPTDHQYRVIGKVIDARRRELGIRSNTALAKLLGVNARTVRRWLANGGVYQTNIEVIADKLKLSPAKFVEGWPQDGEPEAAKLEIVARDGHIHIKVIIPGDPKTLEPETSRAFVYLLRRFMGTNDIDEEGIEPGSTIITLRMKASDAYRFVRTIDVIKDMLFHARKAITEADDKPMETLAQEIINMGLIDENDQVGISPGARGSATALIMLIREIRIPENPYGKALIWRDDRDLRSPGGTPRPTLK